MRVSVVICTFNRSASLAKTLESLTAMEVPEFVRLNILVVDNNSSDNIASVVQSFDGRLPLRYYFESEQGVSHARNRRVGESNGDLIVFTDDDVRLVPGWLARYASAAMRFQEVSFFGGPIEPFWRHGKLRWLVDDSLDLIQGPFGCSRPGDRTKYYGDGEPRPCGANMAYRPEVFEAAGVFRTDLGVRGGDMGRGEETEFVARLESRGYRSSFVAESLCYHGLDLRRTQLREAFRYGLATGIRAARASEPTTVGLRSYLRTGWWIAPASYWPRGPIPAARDPGWYGDRNSAGSTPDKA